MTDTLFGALASRFSTSPENLATESLQFILQHSATARTALAQLLEQIGGVSPQDLVFETQDYDHHDTGIPDLIATTPADQPVYYFEAKFWASLTENQPVTYINRMVAKGAKGLIFISPSVRFSTLWSELLRRCNSAQISISESIHYNEHIIVAKVGEDGQFLALISWKALIQRMQTAMLDAGEKTMVENVNQLLGLADKMDTTGFLPIRPEELSPIIGRRINNYYELIDDVTNKLVAQKVGSTDGLTAAGSREGYLRYILIKDRGCSIRFSLLYWTKYGGTPLWLTLRSAKQKGWTFDTDGKKKLRTLALESPPRCYSDKSNVIIPLFPKSGAEKTEVIDSLIEQIKGIFEILEEE
jgi:hypothetical protein